MLELIDNLTVMQFIKSTYPVSFIALIHVSFGAAINGFARRPYHKNQAKIIAALEREIERLIK